MHVKSDQEMTPVFKNREITYGKGARGVGTLLQHMLFQWICFWAYTYTHTHTPDRVFAQCAIADR